MGDLRNTGGFGGDRTRVRCFPSSGRWCKRLARPAGLTAGLTTPVPANHWAVKPPSMRRSCPVMKVDPPPRRKSTPSAISSGLPTRPMGCRLAM